MKLSVGHTKDPDDIVRHKRLKNQLKSTISQAKLSCLKSLLKQSHKLPQLGGQRLIELLDKVPLIILLKTRMS